MKRFLLVLFASLLGCGGDSTAPPPALAVGVYDYTATVPFFKSDGSLGTSSYSGTLTLTYAAADSIAGTFQASGLRTDTGLGFRNGDAYVLYGFSSTFTATLAHRIRPDLGCTVKFVGPDPNGTCTLVAR
jgi:hypothetical protein